jgi:KDO2-lipid IV(A) lauroyltransferase
MFLLRLISYLPFGILYFVADILSFLTFYVFRYRRKVVFRNLRNSFPEMSENEIKEIAKKFYQNLSDIIVEILKEISITKEEIIKRVKYVNPDELNPYFKDEKSIIVVTIHQGNWEWLLLAAGAYLDKPTDVLYTPLSNSYFDKIMIKARSRFGGYPIPVSKVTREIARRSKIPRMVALLADQTPTPNSDIYWSPFLNQETAFYKGPDVLARFTKYPVFYAKMTRIKRGYYEVKAIKLAEPPYNNDKTDILDKFINESEKTIRENPSNWLWSHRRWKRKKMQ